MTSLGWFKSWGRGISSPVDICLQGCTSRKSNISTLIGVAVGALLGLGLSWLAHLLLNRRVGPQLIN